MWWAEEHRRPMDRARKPREDWFPEGQDNRQGRCSEENMMREKKGQLHIECVTWAALPDCMFTAGQKTGLLDQLWWLMPVIPVTQEVDVGRSQLEATMG
jgi:hypothetical protein